MQKQAVTTPEVLIIDDPEKIKLITDPIKRRILLILRSGEKTARQITEELNEWFADKDPTIFIKE